MGLGVIIRPFIASLPSISTRVLQPHLNGVLPAHSRIGPIQSLAEYNHRVLLPNPIRHSTMNSLSLFPPAKPQTPNPKPQPLVEP